MTRCSSNGNVPSRSSKRLVVEELVMVNCAFAKKGVANNDRMISFFIAEFFFLFNLTKRTFLEIIISESLYSFAHNISLGLLKIRQPILVSQYIPDTLEFLIRPLNSIIVEFRNIPVVPTLQNSQRLP